MNLPGNAPLPFFFTLAWHMTVLVQSLEEMQPSSIKSPVSPSDTLIASPAVSAAFIDALDNEILRQKLQERPLLGVPSEHYSGLNSWLADSFEEPSEDSLEEQDALESLRTLRDSLDMENSIPSKKWSQFSSWGKKSDVSGEDSSLNKRWKSMSVWGKRSGDGVNKRWKQMSAWGKRSSDDFDGLSADKRWKQMSAWGKRGVVEPLDKRWKQMSVWGKRDAVEPVDKRWKQMSVWGKRGSIEPMDKRWKQMSVWGKRDVVEPMDKRWKQMSVWGKRGAVEPMDKRWKQMSVWGKRSGTNANSDESNIEAEKRWKQMSVWGKRNNAGGFGDMQDNIDKKWKQMSVWGKRNSADDSYIQASEDEPEVVKSDLDIPALDKRKSRSRNWEMWGKRPSWSQTGFTSWGKRSEEPQISNFKDFLKSQGPSLEKSVNGPEQSKVTEKNAKQ